MSKLKITQTVLVAAATFLIATIGVLYFMGELPPRTMVERSGFFTEMEAKSRDLVASLDDASIAEKKLKLFDLKVKEEQAEFDARLKPWDDKLEALRKEIDEKDIVIEKLNGEARNWADLIRELNWEQMERESKLDSGKSYWELTINWYGGKLPSDEYARYQTWKAHYDKRLKEYQDWWNNDYSPRFAERDKFQEEIYEPEFEAYEALFDRLDEVKAERLASGIPDELDSWKREKERQRDEIVGLSLTASLMNRLLERVEHRNATYGPPFDQMDDTFRRLAFFSLGMIARDDLDIECASISYASGLYFEEGVEFSCDGESKVHLLPIGEDFVEGSMEAFEGFDQTEMPEWMETSVARSLADKFFQ